MSGFLQEEGNSIYILASEDQCGLRGVSELGQEFIGQFLPAPLRGTQSGHPRPPPRARVLPVLPGAACTRAVCPLRFGVRVTPLDIPFPRPLRMRAHEPLSSQASGALIVETPLPGAFTGMLFVRCPHFQVRKLRRGDLLRVTHPMASRSWDRTCSMGVPPVPSPGTHTQKGPVLTVNDPSLCVLHATESAPTPSDPVDE